MGRARTHFTHALRAYLYRGWGCAAVCVLALDWHFSRARCTHNTPRIRIPSDGRQVELEAVTAKPSCLNCQLSNHI